MHEWPTTADSWQQLSTSSRFSVTNSHRLPLTVHSSCQFSANSLSFWVIFGHGEVTENQCWKRVDTVMMKTSIYMIQSRGRELHCTVHHRYSVNKWVWLCTQQQPSYSVHSACWNRHSTYRVLRGTRSISGCDCVHNNNQATVCTRLAGTVTVHTVCCGLGLESSSPSRHLSAFLGKDTTDQLLTDSEWRSLPLAMEIHWAQKTTFTHFSMPTCCTENDETG